MIGVAGRPSPTFANQPPGGPERGTMKPTMRLDFEYRGGAKDGESRTFELAEGGALDVLDEFSQRLPLKLPAFTVHMVGDNHILISLRGGVEVPGC